MLMNIFLKSDNIFYIYNYGFFFMKFTKLLSSITSYNEEICQKITLKQIRICKLDNYDKLWLRNKHNSITSEMRIYLLKI